MITNKHGYPETIVNAVRNDSYSRGASDISVTQLIQPAYKRKLRGDLQIDEDVSDLMPRLRGKMGHTLLELGHADACQDVGLEWKRTRALLEKEGLWNDVAKLVFDSGYVIPKKLGVKETLAQFGAVVERRLTTEVNGWKVSGAFDLILGDSLQDYKFTKVWSVQGEPKREWVEQLNLLRLLCIRSGIEINSLKIVAILSDWTKNKVGGEGYPEHDVKVIDIPMWDIEVTEAWLLDLVKQHQSDTPTPCSDIERWKKEDIFAVMKDGKVRAIKLHDSHLEANLMANNLGKGHHVVVRPGEYTRCQHFCEVSNICPVMQEGVPF